MGQSNPTVNGLLGVILSVNGILESWIIGIRGLVNGGSERYLEREKGLEHRRLWYRLLDCR